MKIATLLIFSFALACSNNGSGDNRPSQAAKMDFEVSEAQETAHDRTATTAEPSAENTTARQQKIIKTASLTFEVQNVEKTHQKIMGLVQRYNGFVANDNSGKDYGRVYKNMTVRVPTQHFQKMVNAISEGVPYFENKTIARQDVTEEFVDIEARLKAKRELEARYLELLTKAKNVKEMLEIENELSKIREEIEARQGRLEYLKDRVALSTLTLYFYKMTANTGVTVSYGQKIKNALKGGWNGVSVFFIGLLYLWPLFIVALIAVWFIRYLIGRSRKK